MKKILLLSAVSAAAVCAQAQQRVVATAGQDFVIDNIMAASGQNVTYQWFRDGEVIPNATGATYTIPAISAKMDNGLAINRTSGSRFQRAAYGIDCAGGMAMSNVIIVYFCELMVNGVCWAKANADNFGRISSNAWDLGYFYQWNKPSVSYSPTDPAAGVAISGWNATPDLNTWTNGYPCPFGWRLPTSQDLQNLYAMSQPAGGVWVQGGARGVPAGTNGRLYGYNTTYCTMSSMSGCIFLPAAGNRYYGNGSLDGQGSFARYWSNEHNSGMMVFFLSFNNSGSMLNSSRSSNGFSIRCVQDVVQ